MNQKLKMSVCSEITPQYIVKIFNLSCKNNELHLKLKTLDDGCLANFGIKMFDGNEDFEGIWEGIILYVWLSAIVLLCATLVNTVQ